jgi:carbon-monoxide dehydrogenase medium subunit
MKPAPFEYFAPESLEHAVDLLHSHGDGAKVLAGGQSLVPLMNMRLARPAAVVDINRIPALAYIAAGAETIRIGALTRLRAAETSDVVAARCPLLRDALRLVGHVQIRNRGTVGGSVAHADPAAELTAVLALLDGRVVARGRRGTRVIPAADLFVTYLTTSLEADEVLTEVQFPAVPPGAGWSWLEVARRYGDFALAGAGVVLRVAGGAIAEARIGLTGLGPVPVRARAAERLLAGRAASEALWAEAAAAVRDTVEPDGDIHATAEYRRHVAGVVVQRALREAIGRAGDAPRP